jgi:hypothetical protein
MRASTFDVKERRKRIIVFKVGKLWLFKQFFDNKEIFKALRSTSSVLLYSKSWVLSGVGAYRWKYFIFAFYIFINPHLWARSAFAE